LEIRFTAPFVGEDHVPRNTPQLNLTIYDAKTRFVLWTILAPVDGAFRKTTFVRNVNQGDHNFDGEPKEFAWRTGEFGSRCRIEFEGATRGFFLL
jgi:hypothetical protein